MKFTKERKIYAAVLGAGVLALVIDRAFLSPAGAVAALPAEVTPSRAGGGLSSSNLGGSAQIGGGQTGGGQTASASANAKSESVETSAARGLAHRLRLEEEGWLERVRDGFRASESWIPPAVMAVAPIGQRNPVQEFIGSHTLRAIHAHNSEHPRVIVNGRMYGIGDEVNGWVLQAVSQDGARFVMDDLVAELRIAAPKVPMTLRKKDEHEPRPEEPAESPGKP